MRSTLQSIVLSLGLAVTPLAALAPAGPALAQDQAAEAPVKQVVLTDAQIENYIAAKKDVDAVIQTLPEGTDTPDAKTKAKLDGAVKKHGFAQFQDYSDVENNVSIVMAGIDPTTKAYVGPDAVIKKQIAAIEADKKLSAKDRKDALDDLNAALTSTPKLEHKENIAAVIKYYDKLAAEMPQD